MSSARRRPLLFTFGYRPRTLQRLSLGAAANRLDHVYNNLANVSTNTKNATGRIMDVDFASESSSMTSNQMLMQAGTAMLKQTNSMSSMVMSLLQ